MGGRKLFISADSATCDGQPILTGFPSSFSMAGVAELSYNGQGTVLQKGRGGKALHIVHIKQEMHRAPAGFASWVDAVIVGPATVLNFCIAPIFQVVLIALKAWDVLGVLVGVASPDVW